MRLLILAACLFGLVLGLVQDESQRFFEQEDEAQDELEVGPVGPPGPILVAPEPLPGILHAKPPGFGPKTFKRSRWQGVSRRKDE
ncbi:unnamed protein product [Caenorhabditis angaria]|uniref:Uncharacterized protein n=1 Tax=Caenorhabditis angaria TaxID=860376 RepID=A0A9P1ICY8_9PELO|nr:unnamed protein product [Caenorhabditis angaria]